MFKLIFIYLKRNLLKKIFLVFLFGILVSLFVSTFMIYQSRADFTALLMNEVGITFTVHTPLEETDHHYSDLKELELAKTRVETLIEQYGEDASIVYEDLYQDSYINTCTFEKGSTKECLAMLSVVTDFSYYVKNDELGLKVIAFDENAKAVFDRELDYFAYRSYFRDSLPDSILEKTKDLENDFLKELSYFTYDAQNKINLEKIKERLCLDPDACELDKGDLIGRSYGNDYSMIHPTIYGVKKEISASANKSLDIIEGRTFSKEELEEGAKVLIVPAYSYLCSENACTISEVGDKITLSFTDTEGETHFREEYTIIGLHNFSGYEIMNERISGNFASNPIYMPYSALNSLKEKAQEIIKDNELIDINAKDLANEDLGYHTGTKGAISALVFRYSNYDELNNAIFTLGSYLEGYNTVDSQNYYLFTKSQEYKEIGGLITSSNDLYTILFVIATMLCLLLIPPVIYYEIVNRKLETYTLFSLGAKRKRIALLYFLEYAILFSLSFFLFAFIAYFLSLKGRAYFLSFAADDLGYDGSFAIFPLALLYLAILSEIYLVSFLKVKGGRF